MASHLSVHSADFARVTAWSEGLEKLAVRSLHDVVRLALPPVLHNSLEAILRKCPNLTDLSVVVRKRYITAHAPQHAAHLSEATPIALRRVFSPKKWLALPPIGASRSSMAAVVASQQPAHRAWEGGCDRGRAAGRGGTLVWFGWRGGRGGRREESTRERDGREEGTTGGRGRREGEPPSLACSLADLLVPSLPPSVRSLARSLPSSLTPALPRSPPLPPLPGPSPPLPSQC